MSYLDALLGGVTLVETSPAADFPAKRIVLGAGLSCEAGITDEVHLAVQGLAGSLVPAPISALPDAVSVPDGTTFYATDVNYTFIASGGNWYSSSANTIAQKCPGSLTTWTYEGPSPGLASLTDLGVMARLESSTVSASTQLKAFWSPTTLPANWTITACFRWVGQTGSNLTVLGQNVGILLGDDDGHAFGFGPALEDSYFADAQAAGYAALTRNYVSGRTVEYSQLIPAAETYFCRVRKATTHYLTQWSRNGVDWTTGTNGGTDVLQWGSTGQNLTPTKCGIGTHLVPSQIAFDVLSFEVTAD